MPRLHPPLLTCLIALPLLLPGCIAANRSYKESPTLGQELIDLKKAYEQGAINEAQYEVAKSKLINKTD